MNNQEAIKEIAKVGLKLKLAQSMNINREKSFVMALEALEEQDKYKWKVENPTKSGYYLVTYHEWSDGNFLPKYDETYVRRLRFHNNKKCAGWQFPVCVDKECEADTHREVLAYMPLPEPYKV